jgi:hypothetical protein
MTQYINMNHQVYIYSSHFTKKKFEYCVPAPLVGALLLYLSLRGWLVAAGTAAGWVSCHLAWYYLGGGRLVFRLVAAGTAAGWVSLHLAWYYLGGGRVVYRLLAAGTSDGWVS